LGRAAAKLDAAKLMMAASCASIDSWSARGEDMPYLERASVRLHTGAIDELVWEAVDILSRAAGGSFAQESNVQSRIWRDVKVGMSHGMVSPSTNYELYGRALSGVVAPEALI
jgi:alkylation response protein AidB-like acyl-CoA dehydrogenase